MPPVPVLETWAIAVHEALAGFSDVLIGQLVPGERNWELVLTTRDSPPARDLVEELREALGSLIAREDSPVVEWGEDGMGTAACHFYPPLGKREKELFGRLDWRRAVVLHEWVD
jgi:hypothetical protein